MRKGIGCTKDIMINRSMDLFMIECFFSPRNDDDDDDDGEDSKRKKKRKIFSDRNS